MNNKYFNSKDEDIFLVHDAELFNSSNGQKRVFHLITCESSFNELIAKLFSYDYLKNLFNEQVEDENKLKKAMKDVLKLNIFGSHSDSTEYSESVLENSKRNIIIGNLCEIFAIFCFKNIQYNSSDIVFHKSFYNRKPLVNVIESHQGLDYVGLCEEDGENKILILDVKSVSDNNYFKKKQNLEDFWSEVKQSNYEKIVIKKDEEYEIIDYMKNKTIFGFFIFQKKNINSVKDILKGICVHDETKKCTDYCSLIYEAVVFHFKIDSIDDVIKAFETFFEL